MNNVDKNIVNRHTGNGPVIDLVRKRRKVKMRIERTPLQRFLSNRPVLETIGLTLAIASVLGAVIVGGPQ